jgi:hypothetical protein
MMLARGADLNKADDVYGTPLQAAIAGREREVAMALMTDFTADVNARGGAFGNASQIALALDDRHLLKGLDAHGARHNDEDGRGKLWRKAWKSILESIRNDSVPLPPTKFKFMQNNSDSGPPSM